MKLNKSDHGYKFMNLKTGKYQHYKGKFYEVIGVAHHSETAEEFVVYRALYKSMKKKCSTFSGSKNSSKGIFYSKEFGKTALWVRPLKVFLENVIVNGKKVSRFKFIE